MIIRTRPDFEDNGEKAHVVGSRRNHWGDGSDESPLARANGSRWLLRIGQAAEGQGEPAPPSGRGALFVSDRGEPPDWGIEFPGAVAPYCRRRRAARIVSIYSYSARKASRQGAQPSKWRSTFHISSAFSRRRANCSSKSTAGCSSFFTVAYLVQHRGKYSHSD
jgi:hypothetical protein